MQSIENERMFGICLLFNHFILRIYNTCKDSLTNRYKIKNILRLHLLDEWVERSYPFPRIRSN